MAQHHTGVTGAINITMGSGRLKVGNNSLGTYTGATSLWVVAG